VNRRMVVACILFLCATMWPTVAPAVITDWEVEIRMERAEAARRKHELEELKKRFPQQGQALAFLENEISQLEQKVGELRIAAVEGAHLQARVDSLDVVLMTKERQADALFREAERRAASQVWWERAIGFVSGVLASVVAGVLLNLRRRPSA